MSIDMYLGMSDGQASSMKSLADIHLQGYREVQKAIADFANDIESLKGAAYDSARAYYSEILLPLSKGSELLMEKTREGVVKLPADFRAQVDTADLKQLELEEKIRQADQQIAAHNQLLSSISSLKMSPAIKTNLMGSQKGILSSLESSKNLLEEKLRKLLAFSESSKALFSEIESLEKDFQAGLGQANSSWDAKAGVFILPANRSWTVSLLASKANKKPKVKALTEAEKAAFVKNMQEQYGFDEETAKIMLEVKEGIDKKFPKKSQKERDYLLLRILGNVSYNGFQWEQTAGNLSDDFGTNDTVKILKKLGLGKKADKLNYNLKIQNGVASDTDSDTFKKSNILLEKMPETYQEYKEKMEKAYHRKLSKEEFNKLWDDNLARFKGKTDFTHQAITMSTHLNDKEGLPHKAYGRTGVEDLSGWKGDATMSAGKIPKLGNDDYKADLDSVNLVSRMEKNQQSFVAANNQYYEELRDGETNRAKEFLKNEGGYKKVEQKILDTIPETPTYDSEQKKYDLEKRSKEEAREYIRENFPDTENFLKALKQGANSLDEVR